eukprot:5490581-Prymnesium_polylepis.1
MVMHRLRLLFVAGTRCSRCRPVDMSSLLPLERDAARGGVNVLLDVGDHAPLNHSARVHHGCAELDAEGAGGSEPTHGTGGVFTMTGSATPPSTATARPAATTNSTA